MRRHADEALRLWPQCRNKVLKMRLDTVSNREVAASSQINLASAGSVHDSLSEHIDPEQVSGTVVRFRPLTRLHASVGPFSTVRSLIGLKWLKFP